MVMSVNTNISSLNAQQNLATSQSKLATAIQRLSSGMRINSAKDDAAGLAISTRFTTQINGLNQAVANANDGISLAQTTESALNEVTNNLQRIRTLAVQSANGTNSASDRAALDKEVQQRLAEISRIASQTTFNGKHVLDGTAGLTNFQVGADVGQVIGVNLGQSVAADKIGAHSKFAASASSGTDLVAVAGVTTVGAGATLSVGGKTATITAGTYTSATLASAINSAFAAAGISTATVTVSDTSATAINVKLDTVASGTGDTSADIGASAAFGLTAAAATASVGGMLSTADVKTVNGANDMMQSVDSALQTISDMRSDLGAVQNRFQSTIANLQSISQNLSASRSQIQDADFAAETANMTSANILQQAGVSVLAQANTSTQAVLKLLQ
ncbi:MAG: flagellin [Rhodanobacter sp.]